VCAAVSLLILLFFISSTNSNRPTLTLLFIYTLRNLLRIGTSSAALCNAYAAVRFALKKVVVIEVAAASSTKKVVEVEKEEDKN
jgi:hypothetical protein